MTFLAMDLHVHTPASPCFYDKEKSGSDIVRAALDAKLEAIAITDHNTGAWIDDVKLAVGDTGLVIFPGVEITTSEGIHVIGIFDVDKGSADIASLLGALDITPEMQGKSDSVSSFNAMEVIEKINERSGLAILPHIDEPKGVFNVLSEVPKKKLLNTSTYAAVETESGRLPSGLCREKGYLKIPACYKASDNPSHADRMKHGCEGIGESYTYFKVNRPICLDGLRQCFCDPKVRICLPDDFENQQYPSILSLAASEGFMKHQNIVFHQSLNSIIGGKGVGKSLIIELLRFGLFQPTGDPELTKDHIGKLESRLGVGNHVEVVVKKENGTKFKIRRTFSTSLSGPYECINIDTGEIYNGRIESLFPILAYSQTEVIKIAESSQAQLDLIDGFIGKDRYLAMVKECNDALSINDRELSASIQAKYNLDELSRDYNTVKEKIAGIDKSLTGDPNDEAVVRDYNFAEQKRARLIEVTKTLTKISTELKDTEKKIMEISPGFSNSEVCTDPDLTWICQKLSVVKDVVSKDIEKLEQEVSSTMKEVEGRIETWSLNFLAISEKYKTIMDSQESKRKFKDQRGIEIATLRDLEEKIRQLSGIVSNYEALLAKRKTLMDDLIRTYEEYFMERKKVFSRLEEKSAGELKLELTHANDRSEYKSRLTALLRGSGVSGANIQTVVENLMPSDFVGLILKRDIDGLVNKAKLTSSTAQRIVEKIWSNDGVVDLLELEHNCYPKDSPSIQFQRGRGDYAPLNQLSVGQKCTALLIIALSEGNRPVIIDQPEDALDITTVWKNISLRLRECKGSRQFILTTHNPTVSVSSDSDLFIEVKASSIQANVKALGGIEDFKARAAVIDHLEGGDEAYSLRRQKYRVN